MSAPTVKPVLQHQDPDVAEQHLVCAHEEDAPAGMPVLAFCGAMTTGAGSLATGAVDCGTCERLQPEHPLVSGTVLCVGTTFGDAACITCPQHLLRLLG